MAQVIGSSKDESGNPKEKFKVVGLKDTEVHDVLVVAMGHHRNIRNWEVQYDSEAPKITG
jgi:hypothetical protein